MLLYLIKKNKQKKQTRYTNNITFKCSDKTEKWFKYGGYKEKKCIIWKNTGNRYLHLFGQVKPNRTRKYWQ